MNTQRAKKKLLTAKEIAVFAVCGAIMYCSKIALEFLPNIHLLGVLTIVYTLVFRKKALFPIYIYVLLNGLFAGFSLWWIPYLYLWTLLWGIVMLLPKSMPLALQYIVYPAVCCLHGLFFGILYAPMQALLFGLNFEQTLAWIAAGLSFDILHAIGNLLAGLLVVPLVKVLKKII